MQIHALKLAMDKAGARIQLLTIKGGGHGDFSAEQQLMAYSAIRSFLRELGIVAPRP